MASSSVHGGNTVPKAKPTQIIVHRLELQQSERDAFEAALAGNFATNAVSAAGSVLTGMGNLLKPFEGVLTAIGVAWLADKSLDAIVEGIDTALETGSVISDFLNPSKQQDAYQYICAYLQACSGWDGDENSVAKRGNHLFNELKKMNANPILLAKYQGFLKTVKFDFSRTGQWPNSPPAKAWTSYYSPTTYAKDLMEQIPGL